MTDTCFKLKDFTDLIDADGKDGTHKGPYRVLIERLLKTKSPKDRTGPGLFTITNACKLIGIDPKTLKNCESAGLIPPLPRKKARKMQGKDIEPIEGVPLSAINTLRDHYKKSKKFELDGTGAIVIAVANQKGGVGKSNTSNTLSQGLALMGYRVCIIDHDSQATQTANYGLIGDAITADGFSQDQVDKIEELFVRDDATLTPFYMGKRDSLHYALRDTSWDNIKLIPTNKSLFTAELECYTEHSINMRNADSEQHQEQIKHDMLHMLSRGIDTIKNDFDVIIIDGPPSLSVFSLNIMTAADGMIIPMPPKIQDIASTIAYQETIASLLESHKIKEPDFLGVLTTLFQPAKKRTHVKLFEIFKAAFTSKFHFKSVINNVADIEESYSEHLSPYEYEKTSKSTKVMLNNFCEEVSHLILEIKGKDKY